MDHEVASAWADYWRIRQMTQNVAIKRFRRYSIRDLPSLSFFSEPPDPIVARNVLCTRLKLRARLISARRTAGREIKSQIPVWDAWVGISQNFPC